MGAALFSLSYVLLFKEDMWVRYGFPPTHEVIVGFLLIILALEGTRQAFGWVLPIVSAIFILYYFLGHHLPEPFYHEPETAQRISFYLGSSLKGGVWGSALGASAKYVFLFMVLGALFQATGAMNFIISIGKILSRKFKGGPAIAAVVTSAMAGSVMGGAAANVALTGSFTIPMMKKAGLKPEHAGGMEAAASSGGQIMPPIMGAAAFIMAAFLAVPYIEIVVMALIPAILYFVNVAIYAQLQGIKEQLTPETDTVSIKEILLNAPLFFVPLLTIVVFLLRGSSPMSAAFWGIMILLVIVFIRKETRPSLSQLKNACVRGTYAGAQIAAACACIGPVISIMTLSGLGIEFAFLVDTWSGGHLIVALLLTMVVSMILGCGVPTLAAYLIVAMVVGPALVKMGLTMAQAHMFAFFFAVFSYVTPPIAIASLVASGIAGAPFGKTSLEGLKVAAAGFIVPFMFVFCPALLLQSPVNPSVLIIALISILIAFVCMGASMLGSYLIILAPWERILHSVCAIGLLVGVALQIYVLISAGIILFVFLTIYQVRKRRGILAPAT